MNLDELRPILAAYRAQVQQAWSPATAHEGFEGKQGDPAGQCGVTSAWLQRRLLEDHGIETTYCVGHVIMDCKPVLPGHCWLELKRDPDRVVIDLTADQELLGIRGAEVHWDLLGRGIIYRIDRRLTAAELQADPVQARFAVLTEALS